MKFLWRWSNGKLSGSLAENSVDCKISVWNFGLLMVWKELKSRVKEGPI